MLGWVLLKGDLRRFFDKNHHFHRNFYVRRIFYETPKLFSESKMISSLDKYFGSRRFQRKFWKYHRILVPVWRMKNKQKNIPSKWPKFIDFEKKLKFRIDFSSYKWFQGSRNFFLNPKMIDLWKYFLKYIDLTKTFENIGRGEPPPHYWAFFAGGGPFYLALKQDPSQHDSGRLSWYPFW